MGLVSRVGDKMQLEQGCSQQGGETGGPSWNRGVVSRVGDKMQREQECSQQGGRTGCIWNRGVVRKVRKQEGPAETGV